MNEHGTMLVHCERLDLAQTRNGRFEYYPGNICAHNLGNDGIRSHYNELENGLKPYNMGVITWIERSYSQYKWKPRVRGSVLSQTMNYSKPS